MRSSSPARLVLLTRLRARAHGLRERLALGHARPRSDGAPRQDRARGADCDAGARPGADVDDAYGGRFVQSIDGVEGDVSKQRDWFWFLNGIEADRSAADYRLRPGDVEWWDFRSWRGEMREPVVVGAFPEPFLHGYGGPPRPVAVRYEPA